MYIFWINCLFLALRVVTGDDCKTVDKCSCKTSKGTVDLRGLIKGSPLNPRFAAHDGTITYNFEPCQALVQKCGNVDSVSICQVISSSEAYVVGTVDSAYFSGDPEKDTLVLNYEDSSTGRIAAVNLHCSSTEEGTFTFTKENPSKHYFFDLQSKYACLVRPSQPSSNHKLSVGSVLLIIVFVLLAVYFIGGVLFLKFVRGAQGTEMVPNFDFWTSLPGYIKDGVQFTCRGCKTQTSYSRI